MALAVVGGALWRSGNTHGWGWLACTYGIPYLIVNHWLVRPRPGPLPAPCHALPPTSVGPTGAGGCENLQPVWRESFGVSADGAPPLPAPREDRPDPLHKGVRSVTRLGVQVMITLLQHTHKALPHYDGKEW